MRACAVGGCVQGHGRASAQVTRERAVPKGEIWCRDRSVHRSHHLRPTVDGVVHQQSSLSSEEEGLGKREERL